MDDFNLDQIIDSAVEWATAQISLSLEPKDLPLIKQYPSLELKALSSHLRYIYLGEKEALPVIIASHLTKKQEEDLLLVLRDNQEAIGWTMANIKGISPLILQHRIHLKRPNRDATHRVGLTQ